MELKIEDRVVEAEIADTLLRRIWGLSLRKEGKMLFKFPRPTNAKIDMALLSDPLYLYFFDSEKNLIHSEEASPWSWNPQTWRMYSPEKPYQYLLESFEELKIDDDDKIEFDL